MQHFESAAAAPGLSKRAARRIIQRAIVLAARDRAVRGHLKTARMATRWEIADWNLGWTVNLDRGRADFDRRAAKHPDVVFTWPTAAAFFERAANPRAAEFQPAIAGDQRMAALAGYFVQAFLKCLAGLLLNPVDEKGMSLLAGE